MASYCIESIHDCHFQLDTQGSSYSRHSEKSFSSLSRPNLSLIPSKKKLRIHVPIVCCKKKSDGPLKKLQTISMNSSSGDTFPPPPTEEKLDEWMKQSIIEIVRHIQDAPFLHYVFDNKQSAIRRWQKVPSTRTRTESWGMLRNCITRICPDGMIYVQKLNSECKCENCNITRRGDVQEEAGSTDLWGLVIQGRGGGFTGCASYILKTTQIVSPNGCWTQFSLVRAECFCECPSIQFIRSWLF